LGTPVSSTITDLGEEDTYTFNGTVGQRLFYDSLDASFTDGFTAFLIGPSGQNVSGFNNGSNSDSDTSSPFILTETGQYRLVIDGNTDPSGSYSFNLIDAGAAPVLTLGTTITNTLIPGQESDFYRFTGTAGQRLYFDGISGSGATFRLFNPVNTNVFNVGLTGDSEFTLANTGTYIVGIQGSSATDVNYSFRLLAPTFATTALTLGTPVSSTITDLGEEDTYTFTGTVGQRIYYDALERNGGL
jgi:hypothetical protein